MSIEAMSSKERLMAALCHEETDRIPWSPLICGYCSLTFPAPLRGNDLEVQRAIGSDIMERILGVYTQLLPSGIPIVEAGDMNPTGGLPRSADVEVREIWKGCELCRIYETPVGAVTERYRSTDTSPWAMFPVEYRIKTLEDLKVHRYIVEAQQYQPDYDKFIEISQKIGDDGLASTFSPISPFQSLLEVELGPEQFHYFLVDYPKEMEELMEIMHAKNLEACRIIAESPAEVVIIYENTSTSYMSPDMFPRYVLRHLNEYADLYHDAGKTLLMHMCGKLKDILELVGQGRYDGIVDMAPPPTGDVHLWEAKRVWGDRQVANGGIDGTAFAFFSPERMKEHVWEILERISSYRGVILGSGDAVPLGTPLETLRAVTEAVKEFKVA